MPEASFEPSRKGACRTSFRAASAFCIRSQTSRSVHATANVIPFPSLAAPSAGGRLRLADRHFDLLALFARTPGRTYSRTDLLNLVWGYQFEGYEHTVNSHINRLRAKIEADPGHPRYLRTVWGVGYRFAEAAELSP